MLHKPMPNVKNIETWRYRCDRPGSGHRAYEGEIESEVITREGATRGVDSGGSGPRGLFLPNGAGATAKQYVHFTTSTRKKMSLY
jgi:hypothetical protein